MTTYSIGHCPICFEYIDPLDGELCIACELELGDKRLCREDDNPVSTPAQPEDAPQENTAQQPATA